MVPVEQMTSVRFAEMARRLGQDARRLGHDVPTFRSPPRIAGTRRSIRRRPDGSASVAVQLRGRPLLAVAADMVDGIAATNRLDGRAADALRDALWATVTEIAERSAPAPVGSSSADATARPSGGRVVAHPASMRGAGEESIDGSARVAA